MRFKSSSVNGRSDCAFAAANAISCSRARYATLKSKSTKLIMSSRLISPRGKCSQAGSPIIMTTALVTARLVCGWKAFAHATKRGIPAPARHSSYITKASSCIATRRSVKRRTEGSTGRARRRASRPAREVQAAPVSSAWLRGCRYVSRLPAAPWIARVARSASLIPNATRLL